MLDQDKSLKKVKRIIQIMGIILLLLMFFLIFAIVFKVKAYIEKDKDPKTKEVKIIEEDISCYSKNDLPKFTLKSKIKNFSIKGENIYILTEENNNQNQEIIIIDSCNGNILRKLSFNTGTDL